MVCPVHGADGRVDDVTVVAVAGATIVLMVCATVVRVIVCFAVLATYLPDLAIFKVNVHEPVAPIVSVVGFFAGVNVHTPLLDQVFIPGEFVETRADKLVF
jgi:hypothetical protein